MAKHEPMTIEGVTVNTMADAKRANKKYAARAGRAYWFDKGAMSFFNTRLHGGLLGKRYFVTSERPGPEHDWRFSVREILPSGGINTVGDGGPTSSGFNQYTSLDAAKSKAKALAKMGEGIPTNPVKPGYSIPTVQHNARGLMNEGRTQKEAVAIALKSARLSYRKAHPKGPFPTRLKNTKAPCNQPKRKKQSKGRAALHAANATALPKFSLGQEVTFTDALGHLQTLVITQLTPDSVELAVNKHSRPIMATSPSALARRLLGASPKKSKRS